MSNIVLNTKLLELITGLNTNSISTDRKQLLDNLITQIKLKTTRNEDTNLNFICTHNSRRSHLSQIWAQTMAYFYNIPKVYCYSGGTEATALFPAVVTTLKTSGFNIEVICGKGNPIYSIKFYRNAHPIIGFSKVYDSDFNPKSSFTAIMTCSSADKGCPIILGADQRIALTYEDPKAFDTTSQQLEKYSERSLQIATEMKYVFSNILPL